MNDAEKYINERKEIQYRQKFGEILVPKFSAVFWWYFGIVTYNFRRRWRYRIDRIRAYRAKLGLKIYRWLT